MKNLSINNQGGVVLIVGLIMVLLMSIIAMAAIRGSGMQELMAGNVRDRNLAFQAAEAGLREAEDSLTPAVLPPFDGSVTGYIQAIPESSRTGYWDDYSWNTQSAVASMTLDQVAEPPRYVVEEVTYTVMAGAEGSAVDFESSLKMEDATLYRITTRGVGGTETSSVILQSTYKR
jgi:type IV pilus assembly protein PilX